MFCLLQSQQSDQKYGSYCHYLASVVHSSYTKFEDTKVVIRSRKSQTMQCAERKKDKRAKNDLQNTTQKTKDRATRTQLKSGDEHFSKIISSLDHVQSYLNHPDGVYNKDCVR